MENLTHQQIEAVIHWMETWEQLKDTAIPIRFKEDFTKQLQQADVSGSAVKPPIGIMPEWIWKEHRQGELMKAISRYMEAGLKVPEQWFQEFNRHCH